MRAVKGKDTKLETTVRRALWKKGYRYRKNVRSLPGKPDIAVKKRKAAVFLDSCFWHGCPFHLRIPSSNTEYWADKIQRNRARDARVNREYEEMGWTALRIWEHELKDDFEAALGRIERLLGPPKGEEPSIPRDVEA